MLLAGRPLWIKRVMSEYEISKCEKKFVEQYSALMDEFVNEYGTPFYDKNYVETLIDIVIPADDSICLHLLKNGKVIGVVLGIIQLHPFAPSLTVLTEMAWFVTKEERKTSWSIRLMKAFEDKGKEAGTDYIVLALIGQLQGDRLQAIYERMGYSLVEKSFFKKVM